MTSDVQGDDSYNELMDLEELESLLEELEEAGLDADDTRRDLLPADLREHLDNLGVTGMSDLYARIAEMHAELDEHEGDEPQN